MPTTASRPARFESLFDDHLAAVRAYARRRTSPAAADDAVAETFLTAWRRLDEIGDDPLPWLLGVTRRVLANQFRGERRRLALTERLRGRADADPHFEPPPAMRAPLAAALTALSPREREALLLVAWEGLTPARAARVAGCTPAAFRVRLHRARRHVADALEDPTARRSAVSTTPSTEEPR